MKKRSTFIYKIVRPIVKGLIYLFFRPEVKGRENIPKDGPYVLAGNHTKWLDPVMLVAVAGCNQVHFLAKEEMWHGASWNFILWGLYFFIFLMIEKYLLKKYLDKTKVIKHIYTVLIVIISFLIFNTESIPNIINSLKNMFFMNDISIISNETLYYLRSNLVLFIVAIIGATPLMKVVIGKLKETKFVKVINVLEPITYIILLTLTTAFLIDASFNPFLYFRF